jgi:hypothetical protein
VAAFIDILRAYDNVLIDILCDILREEDILQVLRFLFHLLWWKELVFFRRPEVYDIGRL